MNPYELMYYKTNGVPFPGKKKIDIYHVYMSMNLKRGRESKSSFDGSFDHGNKTR